MLSPSCHFHLLLVRKGPFGEFRVLGFQSENKPVKAQAGVGWGSPSLPPGRRMASEGGHLVWELAGPFGPQ